MLVLMISFYEDRAIFDTKSELYSDLYLGARRDPGGTTQTPTRQPPSGTKYVPDMDAGAYELFLRRLSYI